ncbi:methyltransferase domain-containing protein [Defluviimonas sp. WL0002]|uniref:Methyltransferase domain-containing protein n=1 Tax=Albidovulum marisflavi TaxID=2984159 RepID=A0ABT2Z9B3_9RHOB|nr:methyltransferase domain-containing protein [Defluviimonas sp. WL0002]MCV2867729.1 methyltransferase domain-containing protein [Defluviimonas sp. WL0002]
METQGGEYYHQKLIGMLESIWGEGFLSPGGPDEVARLVGGSDFAGKSVLDIGCGAGGIDIALVRDHRAAYVCGIDVEDTVLNHARGLVRRAGLSERIGCLKVASGPLPFPPDTFDIVFSKDSIVHIPDKHALMAEIFRVLKPGGWLVASDWLIGHDDTPSPEMAAYIKSEGLDFGMASPARYRDAMEKAGFDRIEVKSRNSWYREVAKQELARLEGPVGEAAAKIVGREFVDENIGIWTRMIPVLESGEHCPTHLKARKPS